MTTKLVRIDDELGVVFEASLLEQLGIDEHTEMIVTSNDEGIFLQPIRFAPDHAVDSLTGKIMATHSETLRKLAL